MLKNQRVQPNLTSSIPRPISRPKNIPPPGPRILVVTPEITSVPPEMCRGAEHIRAKAGGMAEVSATLVRQLLKQQTDVHLALPHYRTLFGSNRQNPPPFHECLTGGSRVHLAEDSAFYHRVSAYHGDPHHLRGASLAFQREVINRIIPMVRPDIVHCNDWMTSLIPAACKRLGIKTVFTIHNIHREHTTLAEIESRGIDTFEFWRDLYFHEFPFSFEQSYHRNTIDVLASAIIHADYVNTVSPTFLQELLHGTHGELPCSIQDNLRTKIEAGYASGILNAPEASFSSTDDPDIAQQYTAESHQQGKDFNKAVLQQELGLTHDHRAPVLFWPSRLDPFQKGCQLLTEILYQIMDEYVDTGLQLVIVGDGPFKVHFQNIVATHNLQRRVSISDFDENLSRQAFAGSDFVLMPSSFEPCGLPQMIGSRYGTLPIAHNTGGLHDTVEPITTDRSKGNGFVFDHFDANGFRWAIDRAIEFHHLPSEIKQPVIARVMHEAERTFNQDVMFRQYASIYTKLEQDKSNYDHLMATTA